VEPPRHRRREARPPSPPPEEARKPRRSKPPPGEPGRNARYRSPSPDGILGRLIRCSICGTSCEFRCLMSHMVDFSCHEKGCFLHTRPVKVNIEEGVMHWMDSMKHEPSPEPKPRPAYHGGGGTRYPSPFDGDSPNMGPPPYRTRPHPYDTRPSAFDARPPPYNTRPAPYNVREVSPSRDSDRTQERHRQPREDKPHRTNRPRETDRRAPSPSRNRKKTSTFPTRPTGNDPFNDPFNNPFNDSFGDPFDDPFFKRGATRDTKPPADHGRRRDPMEQSISDMDRMMADLGGLGRFKADIPNATPPPETRRKFPPGFMPGPPPGRERDQGLPRRVSNRPPPSDTDPYQQTAAPGRAQAQAPGYGYAPGPVPGAYRGNNNREAPHDAGERTGRTGRRAPSPPRRRRTSRGPTTRTTERGDGRRAEERTRGDAEPLVFERVPADGCGNFMGGDPNRGGRRMSRAHR
jgi:hypothetical protein